MSHKIAIAILCFATCIRMAAAQLKNPGKVGIGAWEIDSTDVSVSDIQKMKFGWYYDWRADQMYASNSVVRTVQFVPMIWDETHASDSPSTKSGILLGFNEPDVSSQSNMTVDQAIALWPSLQASGLRLGSPAPATTGSLGTNSWLGQFMAKAKAAKYRVDFICVHYYTTDNTTKSADNFKVFLEALHAQYNLPIWVTEWALVDWNNRGRFTYQENANFAAAALPMLDSLDYVERHAWYSQHGDGSGIHTELYDSSNQLTAVGKVFQQALSTSTPADTTAPTVSFSAPTNASTVSGTISVSVTAADNVGVSRVEFYVDGTLKNTDTASPYAFSLDTSSYSNTSHTLTAKAYDAAGNVGSSSSTSIIVQNTVPDTLPPTLNIAAPYAGQVFTSPSIVVSGTASDASSGIQKVLVNGVQASGTTSFSAPLALVSGSNTITVVAYDNSANHNATTMNISVVYNKASAADTIAPTVSIIFPILGATVSGSISIVASASDNVGVTRVDFYVDGLLKGSHSASPYSLPLDTKLMLDGSHILLVKAVDAAGNVSSTSPVSILVNNSPAPVTIPTAPSGLSATPILPDQATGVSP